jgi:hypothetical protein
MHLIPNKEILMKISYIASVLALGLFASTNASAVVVGGVDFGATGTFQHIETATFANTFIAPGSAVGTQTIGYGKVSTINSSSDYCAGSCTLYYTYSAELSQTAGVPVINLTNSVYSFYLSGASDIDFYTQTSAQNIAYIQAQSEWVRLTGHDITPLIFPAPAGTDYQIITLTYNATSFQGLGSGLADVDQNWGLADVVSYLDSDQVTDGSGGFADVTITSSVSSAERNPMDTCTFLTGQFCLDGTANLRGSTNYVPEPGGLALLGLGALGLGVLRRRKVA